MRWDAIFDNPLCNSSWIYSECAGRERELSGKGRNQAKYQSCLTLKYTYAREHTDTSFYALLLFFCCFYYTHSHHLSIQLVHFVSIASHCKTANTGIADNHAKDLDDRWWLFVILTHWIMCGLTQFNLHAPGLIVQYTHNIDLHNIFYLYLFAAHLISLIPFPYLLLTHTHRLTLTL